MQGSIQEATKVLETTESQTLDMVRRHLPYKFPSNYIQWRYLSGIIASSLIAQRNQSFHGDLASQLHSNRTSIWFLQRNPIYCLSEGLLSDFLNTDIIDKPRMLRSLKPALHSFILLFPRGRIVSSENSEIGLAIVHVSDVNKPELSQAAGCGLTIPYLKHEHDLNIHLSTIDSAGCLWFSGMGLFSDGSVEFDDAADYGADNCLPNDKQFLWQMRCLVLQTLLVLQYQPQLITDQEMPLQHYAKGGTKGFSSKTNPKEKFLRPRLLDSVPLAPVKKSKRASTGTHASPSPHTRRGHWRFLEGHNDPVWVRQAKVNFE